MGVGRRNHFIPRLLLNRFSSRTLGKKSWIWQVGKDGSAAESSVRDVAVSVDFYGGITTGLEKTFQGLETRFHQALVAIEAGANPHSHAETLTALVWTLSTRTRALRGQVEALGARVVAAMCESVGSVEAQRAGVRAAKAAADRKVSEQLSKLSSEERAAATKWLENGGRERVHDDAERFAKSVDIVSGARQVAEDIRRERAIQTSARSGQLKALQTALSFERLPRWLRPRWWAVHLAEPGTYILGDACVIARSRRGQIGVPMQFGHEEWHTLYLPISSSRVLEAGYGNFRREVTADEINRASAEVSYSYIYSSVHDARIVHLGRMIGTTSPVSAQEIHDMVMDAWKNLEM